MKGYKKGSSSKRTFEPAEWDFAHLRKKVKKKDGQELNHKDRDISALRNR